MEWTVVFSDEFVPEFALLSPVVQEELLAHLKMLQFFGPRLGRPHVDTLKGSKFNNMKELRFQADHGVWRVAFAFDFDRQGVVLVAGDKSGGSEQRFYKTLIRKADQRFAIHVSKGR
jgi:hypothetical protein